MPRVSKPTLIDLLPGCIDLSQRLRSLSGRERPIPRYGPRSPWRPATMAVSMANWRGRGPRMARLARLARRFWSP